MSPKHRPKKGCHVLKRQRRFQVTLFIFFILTRPSVQNATLGEPCADVTRFKGDWFAFSVPPVGFCCPLGVFITSLSPRKLLPAAPPPAAALLHRAHQNAHVLALPSLRARPWCPGRCCYDTRRDKVRKSMGIHKESRGVL